MKFENSYSHFEHLVDGEWEEVSQIYPHDVPSQLGEPKIFSVIFSLRLCVEWFK